MQGRARGFVQVTGPLGTIEHETFTCAHCNSIKTAPAIDQPQAEATICPRCMVPICIPCAKTGKCEPFEKKLEQMEARANFLKQVGF